MKFNGKKIYKKFDKRILMYGISLMLVISAVIVVRPDLLQSSFNVAGQTSRIYLKGILYDNKYFTNNALVTAYNSRAESSFSDDKILIDFDGNLDTNSVSHSTYVHTPADNLIGKLPLTTVTLSTPYHVDVNGDPIYLADLATRKYLNAEGKTVYQFDYITTLKFTFDIEIIDSLCYVNFNGGDEAIAKLAEWGHLENIQALISLSLPNVEGLLYDYDASVRAYKLTFTWTGPDSKKDFSMEEVKSWLETNYPAYDGVYWDRTFIYNNEGIAPSVSVNQPLPIDIVNNEKCVRLGIDRLFIPAVYKAYYEGILIWAIFYSNWYFMIPTLQFDIQLKILITDQAGILDLGDDNTTYTGNPPTPWWPIFPGTSADMSLAILVIMIGGGMFVVLLAYMKRRQQPMGGYY